MMIVPVLRKNELFCMFGLFEKMSGGIYSLRDQELLSIMANQISFAMENIKLKGQLDRAERLAALGKLASGLAHEIRNPITSIKAFFQILNSDEDEADKREIAELASQEIVRIEGLLDNLLSFARPRQPELLHADVRDILDNTLAIIKPEITSGNIRIIKNYCDPAPMIYADEKQLKQVFMNLIFNALQAMPDGGELKVDMSHDQEKNSIMIRFMDSGCGIERKHLPKLFDPFFTTKAQGTGLGLNISQRIVEGHNGSIIIESEKGKGTQAHVILPACRQLHNHCSCAQ
jgi:signal transduction histidine kinase